MILESEARIPAADAYCGILACSPSARSRARSKIYGRAEVPVWAVVENKLHEIRDDDPFDRHTSAIGWPRG